jgi:hypothetical protein
MIGGFMGVGTPEPLIDELARQNKRNLTVIANDTAFPGRGKSRPMSGRLCNCGPLAFATANWARTAALASLRWSPTTPRRRSVQRDHTSMFK